MAITQTKSGVVQYNEYYPFGLQAQRSWTRENSKNNFLGNGGSEINSSSGWYDTFYRGYDPALGRFHQVDPKATMTVDFTPYHYAANNPVMFNDPGGDHYIQHDDSWDGKPMIPTGSGGAGGFDIGMMQSAMWAADAAFQGCQDAMDYQEAYSMALTGDTEALAAFSNGYGDAGDFACYTDQATIGAIINYMKSLNSQSFTAGSKGADGRTLAIHNASGDYVQLDAQGNAFVPYTDIDYYAYRKDQAAETLIKYGQTALDLIGVIPGFGEAADGINAIIYSARGDYGNATLSAAAMVPSLGWGATGAKIAGKALSNADLVQKAARKAEAAIGGVGGVAGTYKHQYANALLDRYQDIFGSRGLETDFYFNHGIGNRGFLDVIDHTNGIIYDYKFGNAVMSSGQYNKYFDNFGLPIQIIRP